MLLALAFCLVAYLVFVLQRIGLFERLLLARRSLSLETIPDRAATRFGDRPLFTTGSPCRWLPADVRSREDGSSWSAARLLEIAGRVARLLVDGLEVGRGDRVAIFKENHFDLHVLMSAIVRAGAIACPVNGKLESIHLGPYLEKLGAKVLFSDRLGIHRLLAEGGRLGNVRKVVLADSPPGIAAARALETAFRAAFPGIALVWLPDALARTPTGMAAAERNPEEALYIVHTSGTTGAPKGVILRNDAQAHALRGWLCYTHVSRRVDRGYLAVPNSHQAVILSFLGLLSLGLPTHWHEAYDAEGFDAEAVLGELSAKRCTGYFGFPATYMQLRVVDLGRFDLRRMRFWASTGDACHEVVQRHFVRVGSTFSRVGLPVRGSVFLDAQGSSEVGTPSVVRFVTPFTRRFGRRIGRPGFSPFGPEIRVVRPDGSPVARGEAGRLEVRGRSLFPGYWADPATTARAFCDGWFFTGDIVRREADGNLVQLDREVDVIRARTGPVYTLPMEEKLLKHPAVLDVCVYGSVQADGFERPAVALALGKDACVDRAELIRALGSALADAEQPVRWEVMPLARFPMGPTGKTLKRVFRESAGGQGLGSCSAREEVRNHFGRNGPQQPAIEQLEIRTLENALPLRVDSGRRPQSSPRLLIAK